MATSFGTVANSLVGGVLRSPLHRLLSGSTLLVRYRGKRSGREIRTPAQYVEDGDDVIILVGKPDTKVWWRNFRRGHPIELLVRGSWRPMTAQAVVGADQPEMVEPLLAAYLARFPRAAAVLDADPETRRRRAVVVRCTPR